MARHWAGTAAAITLHQSYRLLPRVAVSTVAAAAVLELLRPMLCCSSPSPPRLDAVCIMLLMMECAASAVHQVYAASDVHRVMRCVGCCVCLREPVVNAHAHTRCLHPAWRAWSSYARTSHCSNLNFFYQCF